MHLARHNNKRQALGTDVSTVDASTPTATGLILASGTGVFEAPTAGPPIASGFTLTVTTSTPTADATSPASSATSTASALKGSSVAVSTVVAACVGSFIGLALLICLFIWWARHPSTKNRSLPRSPMAENRNARGREEQDRARSQAWDKLEDDGKWEGGMPPPTRQMSQQEMDEKNFPMFKKRSPSTRTTRTTKALEEHGFDLPPIAKYHPDLAKQYALEQPERPYAQREQSGVSWDGETLGDDSFLSLRSVRIESGAMSPTMGMAAKMTPPAMPSQLHHWQSAEVLTVDDADNDDANPFADASSSSGGDDRRRSNSNPFFSAGDTHRASSRRSRSNSRGQSHSRNASRSIARQRVVSEAESHIDPFADLHSVPAPSVPEIVSHTHTGSFAVVSHGHNDSIASGESADLVSDRAMASLIAALDMKQVQRQSLRISMPPSTASRYSGSFLGTEDDVGIARDHPPTPTTPTGH
ncbi:hypothetical protein PHLGIDRAFT_159883 [Phlebiopsis gigantea 11061_1 CR5-6]|uniref:Uncharacterized protein n=1 Tax=Phlebiopsis gigantea (strain 11061_1 CR5-6) TaxID=745531 RepID=A0A0C3SEZ9_PHLG1|nr:hypothetical protein PHLGIDRAFT_159883 [Phlebiopsis gigantea 11061_1 CR5-6]